jgi:CBS domain containing-hemolysin-like protein
VMLTIQRLMYPLVLALNGIGNLVLRAIGIRRQAAAEQYYTPEELRFIVRETSDAGELESEAAQLLAELFEFGELTAADIMVPRVRTRGLPTGATPEQLTEVLREAAHTRYPVYENDLDHIIGMVHIKDVFRLLEEGHALMAADARPIEFIPETSRLDSVLAAMGRSRAQLVGVLDEFGGIAGVVTIEDVFEEVVGHIDESGNDELRPEAEDRAWVAGPLRLAELGEHWNIELEHEEVDTVGGLVLSLLDREPRIGDCVSYGPVDIEVLSVVGHGVAGARAKLRPASEREDAAGDD